MPNRVACARTVSEMMPLVRARCSVAMLGKCRITAVPRSGGASAPPAGCGFCWILCRLDAFDDELAQLRRLDDPPFDQLLDKGPMLFFMFVRQGIRVGTQAHENILLARVRIDPQPNRHFRHDILRSLLAGQSFCANAVQTGDTPPSQQKSAQ